MYIQIFILVKAAFFRGNSVIQLNSENTNKQIKKDKRFDEKTKNLVIITRSLWTKY